MNTTTQSNTNNNPIDWDKHNARTSQDKKLDVLTTCYHNNINPKTASMVLFSAGYNMTAKRVQSFFDGRTKYLMNKRAIESAQDS